MVPANFNSLGGLTSEETCWALRAPTGFDQGSGLASCLPLEHPAAVSLATNCPAVGSETARVGARHQLRMMWGLHAQIGHYHSSPISSATVGPRLSWVKLHWPVPGVLTEFFSGEAVSVRHRQDRIRPAGSRAAFGALCAAFHGRWAFWGCMLLDGLVRFALDGQLMGISCYISTCGVLNIL